MNLVDFMALFQVHVEELDNQALVILSQNTPNLRWWTTKIGTEKFFQRKWAFGTIEMIFWAMCTFIEPGVSASPVVGLSSQEEDKEGKEDLVMPSKLLIGRFWNFLWSIQN